MSGKRGPRLSSFTPTSGLSFIRLMWSSITTMSPKRIERIHAAAGVGDDQQFGAQGPHHADRKGDLPLRVALVGVEPALHRHHRHALQHAADELAGVADGSGLREVRDRGVIERGLGLDLAGEAAQAGAQNDPGIGPVAPMGMDDVGGLGDLRG